MKPIFFTVLLSISTFYIPYIYSTTLLIKNDTSTLHSFCLEYRVDEIYHDKGKTQSAFVPFRDDHISFASFYPKQEISFYIDTQKPAFFLYSFLTKNLPSRFKPLTKRINGVITLYQEQKSYEFTIITNSNETIPLFLHDNGITTAKD